MRMAAVAAQMPAPAGATVDGQFGVVFGSLGHDELDDFFVSPRVASISKDLHMIYTTSDAPQSLFW